LTCLKFDFSATEFNGWPWLRVLVDGQIVDQLCLTNATQSVTVDVDLATGQHLLEFERFNKTDNNTLVDAQGQILKDQGVVLQNIWYQDVKLPMDYLWQGVFCYNNTPMPSVLHWGPNGVWSWLFETPVLPWIISIKNQQRSQAHELFVPTVDRVAEFKQKISKISNDLNCI